MTNLATMANDISEPPCDRETARAETPLRKYYLQEIPADLLQDLKNAERGFHLRRQEFDLAVLLHGMAKDLQDACEAALLTAMILAQSQEKALGAKEMVTVESFGRVQKAEGDKGPREENPKDDKAGLGGDKNGLDSQEESLDTSSGESKNGKRKTDATWMRVKEGDWGGVFMLLVIVCVLYKIVF